MSITNAVGQFLGLVKVVTKDAIEKDEEELLRDNNNLHDRKYAEMLEALERNDGPAINQLFDELPNYSGAFKGGRKIHQSRILHLKDEPVEEINEFRILEIYGKCLQGSCNTEELKIKSIRRNPS